MQSTDGVPIVPADEITGRIDRLQQRMQERGVDGALIVQKTDLFYFAATAQQGWLYVPAEGPSLLMIFKDYQRACSESPLTQIVSVVSPKRLPAVLAEYGYGQPRLLGLELDVLPTNHYFSFQQIFAGTELVDIATEIRMIRAVKSAFEIAVLRRAGRCSDQVFSRAVEVLEAGKTEVAVAGELEGYARGLGHQGIVRMRMWGGELFYGHLMSGDSAAVPSYLASPTGGAGISACVGQGAGRRVIGRDEPILLDYVFALDGYLVDHARIFCIGQLADDLLRAHEAMLALQEWMKTAAQPGAITGELYDEMVSRADRQGYGDWFMGVGDCRIRFTGHGVGLELDEFPFIAKGQTMALTENMVLALEPKVVFPGRGVVGIENTHLVGASGLEPLTTSPDGVVFLPC